jgi:hypothetical protein
MAVATIVGAQGAGHLFARLDTRAVAVGGLVLATGGYLIAMHWFGPLGIVLGLSLASLGIGATFVTAFTSALADAEQEESGLRSAIVGTFHELGGALGVAALATAAGAGLTATRVDPDDFTRAFTVGAVAGVIGVVLAAVLVPAVKPPAGHAGAGHGH